MSQTKQATSIRDRIVDFKRVRCSDIALHPMNPRTHDKAQREQLRGSIGEIGVVEGLLTYYSERNGGRLTLIDGEMRSTEYPDMEWPCEITDLNDEEADKYLILRYPIEAGAGIERENLEKLLEQVRVEDDALNSLLSALAAEQGITSPGFQPVGIDEQGRLDEKAKVTCPECGAQF